MRRTAWKGRPTKDPAFCTEKRKPLSGFFAKLILVRAGLESGQYALVTAALVVGLLTLFSMTKIWNEAFWKPAPETPVELAAAPAGARSARLEKIVSLGPMAALAACTVAIGLAAGPVFAIASAAAEQLLDPQQYIQAVLGGST